MNKDTTINIRLNNRFQANGFLPLPYSDIITIFVTQRIKNNKEKTARF